MSNSDNGRPVVFVHGLWMHASTWEPWMALFREHGYRPYNPPWPGDAPTVEGCRANPASIAGRGVKEVADSYAAFIATLDTPPLLVGHSFGGLVAQILLGRNLAAGAVAIDPGPPKGVWQLPLAALRSGLPVLANPANRKRAVSLTFGQFRYGFANAISEAEASDLYERNTIPAPGLPLFQVATATFNSRSETRVDVRNAERGPLLITAAELDHQVPPTLSRATFRQYRHSAATTDFHQFSSRGHSLCIDQGWTEVAETTLRWFQRQGLMP